MARARAAEAGARSRSARSACALGVPYALDAGGFGRHTFLCGQSGSGKTYSLGLVLERLLRDGAARRRARPELRLRAHGPHPRDVDAALAARLRRGGRPTSTCAASTTAALRLRFAELDAREQAALLRLDPVADREEYAQLVALFEDEQTGAA